MMQNLKVDAMCADLDSALGFEWEVGASFSGLLWFTVTVPNGTTLEVNQMDGHGWEFVIGWPTVSQYDGVSVVHDTWGEVVAEVADLGASLR